MKLGIFVFGLAAAAAGIVDLVWGGLDPAHQPLQAWGDNVPGREIISYVLAFSLAGGGAAVLFPRSTRVGAGIVAAVYLVFAFFWLPRFYTAPQILGHSVAVYIGVLGGVCQELFVAAAALIIFGKAPPASRWIFGISAACFGLVHLTGIQANIAYVPHWMPLGRAFWVGFTGVAFILAGIAIVSGILDVLAARLLSLMWLVFSAVTLLPGLAATLRDQASWGGNAYEILVVASAWILAEWLAQRRTVSRPKQGVRFSTA